MLCYVAHSRVGFFGLINYELIRNKRKRQATIDTSVFELLQIGLGREGRYDDGTVYSLNGSGETRTGHLKRVGVVKTAATELDSIRV